MRFPSIGGLANALGLGVQGYGQDVATNLQRERQRLQDQQSTQKFGLEQDLGRAQIGNLSSEVGARNQKSADDAVAAAGKKAANQKSFNMIAKMSPDHPMVTGGFDPNIDYTGEAKGVVEAWVNDHKPKPPQAPLLGSPEYLQAQTNLEKMRAALRPDAKDHYTFPTGVDASGKPMVFRANTSSGDITPTDVGANASGGARSVASLKKAIASNTEQLSIIDDAVRELDAHPDAVGLKRGVPFVADALNQRSDPGGIAARAQIGNVGSMIIHDRSGSAVTVHEMPRLAPFVPNTTDTPEAIRIKLKKLRAAIEVETGALQQSPPPAQGGGRAGGGSAGPTGDINLGASKATATPQQLERAKTDPLYAQFLRETGKMP